MIDFPRQIDVQMIKIFKQAQEELFNEFIVSIETWKDLTYLTARINSITNELITKYWTYQNIALRELYLDWTLFYDISQQKEINNYLKESDKFDKIVRLENSSKLINWLWWVNPNMVEMLLQQGNNYIIEVTNWIKRWILWTFSEAKIKQTFENMAKSEIKGVSIFESRSELVKFFWQSSIWSFMDKSWRKRTLERYWEMLTRTETAKASIIWTLTEGQELWFTKYKRIERSDSCPVCQPHRSDVINLRDWMPYILLHPQCRGYWEPVFD